VIGGAAEMAHTASNMAMLQLNAPEEMRGRISSLTMLYPAMISVGAFVAGPLSDLLGVRGASIALAASAIAASRSCTFLRPCSGDALQMKTRKSGSPRVAASWR